jgi:hypothetical protein
MFPGEAWVKTPQGKVQMTLKYETRYDREHHHPDITAH